MSETKKPKDVIRPTDAEAIGLAKRLVRTARYGALAVLDPADGAPLASRTAVATAHDGSPIILVSSLSAHTGALLADSRCSLLLGEPGKGDPLAHPRITLSCRARRLERGTPDQLRVEKRYLARHPKASLYAGFGDFSYFLLDIGKASLNGGFGKAYSLTIADITSPRIEGLAELEESAVQHMNADHGDAIAVYARAFGDPSLASREAGWSLTGMDSEGLDVACGDTTMRVAFPQPLGSASDLQPMLVDLATRGRALLTQS